MAGRALRGPLSCELRSIRAYYRYFNLPFDRQTAISSTVRLWRDLCLFFLIPSASQFPDMAVTMKFVSFNINGLRARSHQLAAIIAQHQPDIIGLQETKVHDDMFPFEEIRKLGYQVYY